MKSILRTRSSQLTTILRHVVILFLLLLAVEGCKHGNDSASPIENLTATKKDVTQYEVVSFKLDSTTAYTGNAYDATIGGMNIKVGRVANNFSFIVPAVDIGLQSLEMTLNNKKIRIDYTIKKALQVSDPSAYLSKYLTTFDSLATSYDSRLSKGSIASSSAINKANVDLFKSYLQQLRQQLLSSSDDDKKVFATCLYNNAELLGLTNILNGGRVSYYYNYDGCTLKLDSEIGKRMVKILSLIVIGGTAYGIPPFQPVGIFVTLIITKQILDMHDYITTNIDCSGIMDGDIAVSSYEKGGRARATILATNSDQPVSIDFKAPYRNIQLTDQNSNYKVRSNIVSLINTFKSTWETVQSVLTNKLTGKPVDMNSVKSVTQMLSVSPELLSITSISDPAIKIKNFTTANGKYVLTFVTDKEGQYPFTFDVKYDNPGVSTRTSTIQASITNYTKVDSVSYVLSNKNVKAGEFIDIRAKAYTKLGKEVSIDASRWQWSLSMPTTANTTINAYLYDSLRATYYYSNQNNLKGSRISVLGNYQGNVTVKLTDIDTGKSTSIPINITENYCQSPNMLLSSAFVNQNGQTFFVRIRGGYPLYNYVEQFTPNPNQKISINGGTFDCSQVSFTRSGRASSVDQMPTSSSCSSVGGFLISTLNGCKGVYSATITDSKGSAKSISVNINQ